MPIIRPVPLNANHSLPWMGPCLNLDLGVTPGIHHPFLCLVLTIPYPLSWFCTRNVSCIPGTRDFDQDVQRQFEGTFRWARSHFFFPNLLDWKWWSALTWPQFKTCLASVTHSSNSARYPAWGLLPRSKSSFLSFVNHFHSVEPHMTPPS